jgi:hypothetical protein
MRKLVVAALVGALTLTGAVAAWAVTSDQSTVDTQVSVNNKRDGTRAKPSPKVVTIRHDQGTTTGGGQPETTDAITFGLSRQMRLNTEIWPATCNINTVNQQGSDSSCPRRARVGRGVVNLLAGDGSIQETADLRAWVTRTRDLMIFLDSRPGEPVELNAAVLCNVTRRRVAKCDIPATLERPAGVKSSIDTLTLVVGASTRIRGKRRGIIESVGCRRFWTTTFNVLWVDGKTSPDSDRVRC